MFVNPGSPPFACISPSLSHSCPFFLHLRLPLTFVPISLFLSHLRAGVRLCRGIWRETGTTSVHLCLCPHLSISLSKLPPPASFSSSLALVPSLCLSHSSLSLSLARNVARFRQSCPSLVTAAFFLLRSALLSLSLTLESGYLAFLCATPDYMASSRSNSYHQLNERRRGRFHREMQVSCQFIFEITSRIF